MRTILAFVFATGCTTIVVSAQPTRQLSPGEVAIRERTEKRIAAGTATVPERAQLANMCWAAGDFKAEREQEAWIIENHPEAAEVRRFPPDRGRDTAQIADAWRAAIANPGVSPKAISNAAWYFRLSDRPLARSIVDTALAAHPHDPDLARMIGVLDIHAISGARPQSDGGTTFASPDATEAQRAHGEIDASVDAPVLVGAADTALEQFPALREAPIFRDEDALAAAERWTLHAKEIDPANAEIPKLLSRVYEREAQQASDPGWKVELFRKADTLDPNFNLPQLAAAEFEAGDDEGAARDAHRALDRKNPNPNVVHRAHTVLGRVALARGDVAAAKAELVASIPTGPGNYNIPPDRSLAQDLLDKGERETVVNFLERFRPIWQNDDGALDYYVKVAKSPGHPDVTAGYRAGMNVQGRQIALPDEYKGKPAAIAFGKADCSLCDTVFTTLKEIASTQPGLRVTFIDAADKNPLAVRLEVETYPTIVLVGPTGGVPGYLAGNIREQNLRDSINRMMQAIQQPRLAAPRLLSNEVATKLEWSRVEGAQSYVVQLDQRDAKGWRSDRDDKLVRVIPSAETSVTLDPSLGETAAPAIRWRVFAVSQAGAGAVSDWREVRLERP